MPPVSEHEVISERIHPALDGVRIGHISDIHVRRGVRPRRLERAVELLNLLQPDFVAMTGDYVCFSPRPLPRLTTALRRLTVPTFATLGNHDHWCGAPEVRAALLRAGVQVLTNEHRVLDVNGRPLHLVGLDDPVTKKSDPELAFDGVPEDATSIVLSHCPDYADRLRQRNAALVLSGHTHGGQVFIKRVTPYVSARLGMKYLHGFFDLDGTILYVNRGLGAGVPLRFRAPPEVTILTLRSAARGMLGAGSVSTSAAA